jgi:hypothetical protein
MSGGKTKREIIEERKYSMTLNETSLCDVTPCTPLKFSFQKIFTCHLLLHWFLFGLSLEPEDGLDFLLQNFCSLPADYMA